MKNKIAAVIVTYNRLQLLKNCIRAIRGQSRIPNEIIVINNGSTDSTEKWLSSQSDLTIITQQNEGSAGGQYRGIQYAYEKEYDWIWCMDDDVIPNKNCLSHLLEATTKIPKKIGFVCSNVFSEDHGMMNMPSIYLKQQQNENADWNRYLKEGIVRVTTATFVSILFNRLAIKKVGYPLKDLFIWGDDTEYTLRISQYYPNFLVGKSECIHLRPNVKILKLSNESNPKRISMYFYAVRNGFYNHKRYYGTISLLKYVISLFMEIKKYIFQKYGFLKLKVLFKGLIAGIFFSPKNPLL